MFFTVDKLKVNICLEIKYIGVGMDTKLTLNMSREQLIRYSINDLIAKYWKA